MKRNREFLGKSFGEGRETYDRIRPDYPRETIEDIIQLAKVRPDARILEIGSGTGKATLPFAERGLNITALDASPELTEAAKKNLADFPNVQFVANSFEDAELEPQSYELITSAQAFHWVNPDVRYRKAHEVLKDNGHLAIFANFQNREKSGLEQEVDALYRRLSPNYSPSYGSLERLREELQTSGLFSDPLHRTYDRVLTYSRDEYLDLQRSFSWIATLPEEDRAKFFLALNDLLGKQDHVAVPWQTSLLLSERT